MTDMVLGSNKITQIGIVVPNIEEAVHRWAVVLGVEPPNVIITDTVDIAHTEYHGHPSPARAKLAFFHLGQVDLELIEPVGEPSAWRDGLVANGPSLHHIAFQIKGMSDRVAALAEAGMPLVQRGDYTGGRYAYVDGQKDFGTVVELLEND